MTNLETAMALLERHRHGMAWTDKAVAEDMLKTFGIEADKMFPVTADEVAAHEMAAQEAADRAKSARESLEAQRRNEPAPYVPPIIPEAHIPSAPIVPPVVGTHE